MLHFENVIKGRVGFSINISDIKSLIPRLVSFSSSLYQDGAALLCNSSGGYWANIFKEEFNLEASKYITIFTNDKPCSYYEHLWLTKEITNKKCIAVYITDTLEGDPYLNIKLNYPDLAPLYLEELNTKSDQYYLGESGELEVLNIDNYGEYLLDNKLINLKNLENMNLNIDCMFGSTENFFNSFSSKYPASIRLFNRQSQPIRLINYSSNPSGQFLQNYALTCLQEDYNHLFFGISSDGFKIGCYDLKQNIEINPSSLILLLAYYYAKIENRKGSILLTSITSNKVLDIINNFNLAYEIIDCGEVEFYEAVNKKRKRPLLFYANEYGCIHFKSDIACPNPYLTIFKIGELCKVMGRSPGQLIDIINSAFLKNTYYNIIISYFIDYISLDNLKAIIEPLSLDCKEYKKSLIYSLVNNVRLAIKINLSYNRFELYFESVNEDNLKKTSDLIQEGIRTKCSNIYL